MVGVVALSLRGSCNEAQPVTLCKIFQMLRTNPGKVGDLGIGEEFLAGFHCDHGFRSRPTLESLHLKNSDAEGSPYEWKPQETAAFGPRPVVLPERAGP